MPPLLTAGPVPRPLALLCSEKDIPIDMLELPNKSEKIMQLAWEPRGSRFAVLHGEGSRPTGERLREPLLRPQAHRHQVWPRPGRRRGRCWWQPRCSVRPKCHVAVTRKRTLCCTTHVFVPPHPHPHPPTPAAVSIYNMKDTKSTSGARGVVLLHSMTNKQCTSLHWSPSGRFLLLAGLGVSGPTVPPQRPCKIAKAPVLARFGARPDLACPALQLHLAGMHSKGARHRSPCSKQACIAANPGLALCRA